MTVEDILFFVWLIGFFISVLFCCFKYEEEDGFGGSVAALIISVTWPITWSLWIIWKLRRG